MSKSDNKVDRLVIFYEKPFNFGKRKHNVESIYLRENERSSEVFVPYLFFTLQCITTLWAILRQLRQHELKINCIPSELGNLIRKAKYKRSKHKKETTKSSNVLLSNKTLNQVILFLYQIGNTDIKVQKTLKF